MDGQKNVWSMDGQKKVIYKTLVNGNFLRQKQVKFCLQNDGILT